MKKSLIKGIISTISIVFAIIIISIIATNQVKMDGDGSVVSDANIDPLETGEDWVTYYVDTPSNRLLGYKDKNGVVKIEAQFEYTGGFDEGIAMVGKYIDNWQEYQFDSDVEIMRYGYINTKGDLIVPMKFVDVSRFKNGKARVTEEDGTTYFIDREGNQLPDSLENEDETGESWVVFEYGVLPSRPTYGYRGEYGTPIIVAQFEYADNFSEGIAIVGKYIVEWKGHPETATPEDLRYGYINTKGELIVPMEFLEAGRFEDGKAQVTEEDGTTYFIDREGNRIED